MPSRAPVNPPSGPGRTRLSREAYALAIRMMAENFQRAEILREIHTRFPKRHGPEGDLPCTAEVLRNLSRSRQDEINDLRKKLNESLSDLWIANKRTRITALQRIFSDANRWVPKRLIESQKPGSPTRSIVVYEKDTKTMLKALEQARAEIGGTPEERTAQSLEDLVRLAEENRGLERTVPAKDRLDDAVPVIEDAQLLEAPDNYPSRGSDEKRGFVDGRELPSNVLLQQGAKIDREDPL